eukprot:3558875-Amphidinium_carterae.1
MDSASGIDENCIFEKREAIAKDNLKPNEPPANHHTSPSWRIPKKESVFANPTRTRFWRVVLSNSHPGLQGNSPGNHKSCYELLRPFQTLSASMLDCV